MMDRNARDELVKRVWKLRRTADTGGGRTAYFFSPSDIKNAIRENDIHACLRLFLQSRNSPHSFSNERYILRLAKEIAQRNILIFATLLVDDRESFILEFVFRRDTDTRLPFNPESLDYLDDITCRKFWDRQWEFHPVILQLRDVRRVLRQDEVVPFAKQDRIGRGAFGDIWKAELYPGCHELNSGGMREVTHIARKVLSRDDAKNERDILELIRDLKHPNIVEFLGSYEQGGQTTLLFPLADMNLIEFLLGEKTHHMATHDIYASIHGLADALCNIHNFFLEPEDKTPAIGKVGCHHDLRPKNILVHHGTFVIADFGLSKLGPDDQDSKTPVRGCPTDDYLPPGHFYYDNGYKKGSLGRASDNWAFGCILAELATFIEGRDVGEFRTSRRATFIVGNIEFTNCEFHLDGKIRPSVTNWLNDLKQQPKNGQTMGLIEVACKLMNPDTNARSKISEVLLETKTLAVESTYSAVERAFTSLRDRGGTFIYLEQIRVRTWWAEYQAGDEGKTIDALPALQKLEKCLRSHPDGELLQSTSESVPQTILTAVDELCDMLPEEGRRNFAGSWFQTVSEMENIEMLSAIRCARRAPKLERYREVGISAITAETTLAISNPINFGQESRLVDPEAAELDENLPFISCPQHGSSDTSEPVGYFERENEHKTRKHALAEWKEYAIKRQRRGEEQLSYGRRWSF